MLAAPSSTASRFNSRASLYQQHRPTWPGALAAFLAKSTSLGTAIRDPYHLDPIVVADIGSGTGISSAALLRSTELGDALRKWGKSLVVVGVEPNPEMRRAAQEELREYISPESDSNDGQQPGNIRFRSVEGSAEHTGLESASVDLAVGLQCAHWWAIPSAARELRRILRQPAETTPNDEKTPSPNVVIGWNSRPELPDGSDGMERLASEFGEKEGEATASHSRHPSIAAALFHPSQYETLVLPNTLPFTRASFKGYVHSVSYMPKQGTPDGDRVDAEVDSIFDSWSTQKAHDENELDWVVKTNVYYGTIV
ncbi:hypothetical protein M427DRAFT_416713 [Gonapodya prolifera JEL478]|uniref:Methyltransferase type 11 domain-containing protein n=1 Tax=Gonapodya prolifera (strain JEL478) TaxID=1344416 RepID=A0A139A5L0_GONPJ|nr:hypothetical protein M427DRAFT_416713 [Gonapodya prolifera JEL478]|eukprot:KXS11928.1 hypothetical protein M427DRAFT_416713 [Gonapodya prolifera JEL478]